MLIIMLRKRENGVVFASGLAGPEGLAFDRSGNLYVANYNNGTIYKFDSSGIGPPAEYRNSNPRTGNGFIAVFRRIVVAEKKIRLFFRPAN